MARMECVRSVLNSKSRVRIPFKGNSVAEAVKFGYSYLESEDHIVEFITCSPKMMKRILTEVPDAELLVDDPKGGLGRLWTATMLVTDKLGNNQIVFSNNTFSAVVDVYINPNPDGD